MHSCDESSPSRSTLTTALCRSTMFGTQCGSLPPCVQLSSLGCCGAGLLLLVLHPSSLTVVAPYSDDACAEILLVTVLIVEQSLTQAVTQLHVQERLCHLHTLDDPLRPREDISASHPIPVPRAPESILHIECLMTENIYLCRTSDARGICRSCKDRPTTGWRRSCRHFPDRVIRSRGQ